MSTGFEAFHLSVGARLWAGQFGSLTVVLLEAQVLCGMMLYY
jgi:hypothetical protein